MITTCCVCGSKVETKKILSFRNLIGSGVETYEMHIARCDNCGFIFQQNPLTPEQLENRYKNESKYEFDVADNVFSQTADYIRRCYRQKHFIEENLASEGYDSILEIGAASWYRTFSVELQTLEEKLRRRDVQWALVGVFSKQ